MRFNKKKFDNLILYVCKKTPTAKLGAIKLNKILYYADMLKYLQTGRSITGETYLKRQFGPVPKRVLEATERLQEQDALRISDSTNFGYQKRDFITLSDPDLSSFDAGEISLVDSVISSIANGHTAMSISEASHTDVWEIAQIGEDLPYSSFLVTSLGEINEEDVSWGYQAHKVSQGTEVSRLA